MTKENRPAGTGRLDDLAVTDQCNALGEIAITDCADARRVSLIGGR